jgi:putative membrane protein
MGLVMAAGTTMLLAACGGNKDVNRDTTAAGTTPTDTAGMAGMSHDTGAMAGGAGVNNGNSSAPASAKKMTDAEVFAMVKQVNVGEIEAGKLAQTKATNGDVKSFAGDMVSAHTKMLNQGMTLGKTLGAKDKPASEDSIAKANTAMAGQLRSAAKGAAFDKAYIDGQVAGHQAALQLVQNAAGQAQNADLKKMLTDAQPEIQKHLDRAKEIQGKLGQK